jgi:methionine biosynthesis protein MetW
MPKYNTSIFNPQSVHPDDAHSILMRAIPAQKAVLELGCATGYLSAYMTQTLGCKVIGLEYDADSVTIARDRCEAAYVTDLDADNALENASKHAPYDVVLAAAVLEHLKFPERLLNNLKPLLNPNALVIVSLPNIAHWSMRLQLLSGNFNYTDYGIMDRTHCRLYTLKTGRELLEQQGYRVEDMTVSGSGLQNLLNQWGRKNGRKFPLVLPNLFGYELIYFARLK